MVLDHDAAGLAVGEYAHGDVEVGVRVIVTGAAGGIGSAITWVLLREHHEVVAVDRQPCPTTLYGWACRWVQGDVSQREIQNLAVQDGADGLVNAAGITCPPMFDEEHRWDETWKVNATAPYFLARRLVEVVRSWRGYNLSIVNVASIGAYQAFPGNVPYQASKAALVAATRAMALDWAPAVRVNSVSPGYIRTAMTEASWNDPMKREARTARTMLGRWGTSEEVAQAVLFLLDPARSGYITGVDLPVDGGWLTKGL